MTGTWRLARALETYRKEVDARWPDRDKRSDGTIGDAAHATRSSDHNPWLKNAGIGVVRAVDVDKDLTGPGTQSQPAGRATEADQLAEHLRALGAAGDPRLADGGYVIWNRRIASQVQGWIWRPYTGANTHEHHVHLSVSRTAAGFDSPLPWGINVQEDDVTNVTDQEKAALLEAATTIEQALGVQLPSLTGDPAYLSDMVRAVDQRTAHLVLAAESLQAAIERVPAAVLSARVGPVRTMRDGKVVTEEITVAQSLTRSSEASEVRQVMGAAT